MSNTITAYFKGRVGVAESVYQNDYGIVMNFDSIDLPAHFDCYFSILNQEEAIPGVGADGMVAIPNSVLANPGTVTIYIPLHTGANDSEVEYTVYFKVIGRARPINDGAPTQMTAIEQALALLQNPITNIEQIVNEALAFTGETFEEMQEDLDEWKTDTEEGLDTWKGGVESDFNTLQAQFDTAVGAVTTDTEVTDIRVGADGVTDATAGASVRRQFNDVKNTIDAISTTNGDAQLYNKKAAIPNLFALSTGVVCKNDNVYRCFVAKVDGENGALYSFNYCGTNGSLGVKTIRVGASSSYPVEGATIPQLGSTSLSDLRGAITLNNAYSYISVFVEFNTAELATANTDEFAQNLVVRKGRQSNIYMDYATAETVRFIRDYVIGTGTNLLTGLTPTLGTGWSGNLSDGFTHTPGNTDPLTIPITLAGTNTKYLLHLVDANRAEANYSIKLGGAPACDPYNGTVEMYVGYNTTGSNLIITPKSNYSGTITQLAVYDISKFGTNAVTIQKNSVIGKYSNNDITSFWNVVLGDEAFASAVNATRSIAIGRHALNAIVTGNRNVAIGSFAANALLEGERNIAIGSDALWQATKATDCVAIGKQAMPTGTNVHENVAVGNSAMGGNDVHAEYNVAVGHLSGFYNAIGNTSVGYKAGYYTKGNNNVSVGRLAGQQPYITGNSNVYIGAYADGQDNTAAAGNIVTISDSIAIGTEAKVTKSQQMVLGSTRITEVVMCGNKKINFNDDGTVTWETLS